MKAYYLLAPLCVALLGGCAVYSTTPATVAYVQPAPAAVAYVSPTYIAAPTSYRVIAP
ncbi:MAG TPA: hypothetical protein VN649_11045 [Ramlibacter sp.]|nr:hypothetical protein [Ramlibacter sp.]